MLDYAQIQIFHAVTTYGHIYGRYQGCLLLIFILHNLMHAITRTLPVGDMAIGLHRDVWIAAIASSRTRVTTLSGVMCNTSQ